MTAGAHAGEVALVTGANKGIGREIAARLAAEGMTVYLAARDAARGRAAAEALDGDVRFLLLDVTDEAQVADATATIDAACGRLDVLVNNAGIVAEWGVPLEEITVAQVREAFEVNVLGTLAVTQACLPLLRRARAARVVNLSSPLGSLTLLSTPEDHPAASRGLLAYSSSKAAVNALTLVYAEQLRESGIAVNAVNPGLVATDLNAASPFSRGERDPAEGARVPVALALGAERYGTGEFRGSMEGSPEETVPW